MEKECLCTLKLIEDLELGKNDAKEVYPRLEEFLNPNGTCRKTPNEIIEAIEQVVRIIAKFT